jgi:hypothetical protein
MRRDCPILIVLSNLKAWLNYIIAMLSQRPYSKVSFSIWNGISLLHLENQIKLRLIYEIGPACHSRYRKSCASVRQRAN